MIMAKCHPEKEVSARGLCSTCYNKWSRETFPGKYKEYQYRLKSRAQNSFSTLNSMARRKGHAEINMSREEYLKWYYHQWELSAGHCQCCKIKFSLREPQVDHCHITGQPRAFLCKDCNTIEGRARSTYHLQNLLDYFREHNI